MKLVVGGILPDGRSGVVQQTPLSALHAISLDGVTFGQMQDRHEAAAVRLWKTEKNPPEVDRPTAIPPSVPPGEEGTAPGAVDWVMINAPAHAWSRPMHRTDLLSYNAILSGSVDLILESETVRLTTGDCFVCLGVLHGWESTDQDSILLCSCIGLNP